MIEVKRVYEPASRADGARFLVERLWPRGLTKEALRLDGWLKDVAPSTTLRKWFGHDPKRWDEFRRRYFAELEAHTEALRPILDVLLGAALPGASAAGRSTSAARARVTLLFSARDTEHNSAVALREYLTKRLRR